MATRDFNTVCASTVDAQHYVKIRTLHRYAEGNKNIFELNPKIFHTNEIVVKLRHNGIIKSYWKSKSIKLYRNISTCIKKL